MKNTTAYAMAAFCLLIGGNAMSQGNFGDDPEQCKMNISLYQDAMSRNDISEAYAPWRRILELCPAWSKGVYQNGAKIMSGLIAKEQNADRKKQLIDSLYMVHDMRIEHFGEEAYVLGRKGQDMLMYEPARCSDAYDILKKAIELGGTKSEAGVLSAYYQALNCKVTKGETSKDEMISDYVLINEHLEKNLSDPNMKEADRPYYMTARDNVNNMFLTVAECADIIGLVKRSVQADPGNNEMKARMLKVLNTKECTDDPIYRQLVEDVHRASPSSESAYSLGMMLVRQNEMTGALRYMKEALDLCEDCPEKARYLLKAGQIASAAGNHAQSKAYANQLLQIEPKNGEAFMLIGNAIAAQAASCEGPQAWGVYWLAYDYYQRAKSNDPSVSDKAGERMAASQGRFPTTGEAFFHGLSDGQTFQVTCGGLNESTTVRTRKEK